MQGGVCELLSPWSWGVPHPWYLDVFAHLEAPQSPHCRYFPGASSRGLPHVSVSNDELHLPHPA